MTKKLILIDGSSVLSRNYYGSLPNSVKFAKTPEEKARAMQDIMQTKDGLPTNGMYAMIKFLLKLIKEQQPTHMAIFWDVSRDTFRKKMYSDYKGTRGETPKALKIQFDLVQKILEYMGIKQYKLEGFEADDLIGTFAKKFENTIPIYIITGDQDALQLVNERTKVWLTTSKAKEWYFEKGINPKDLNIPDKTFEYTIETVLEHYGLYPKQIIDLKALEGDSSDNIPGVKGVGLTAIKPLLRHYGTIEQLYKALETTPEIELKTFFKEELKIPRSPIGSLMKRSNQEIAGEIKGLLIKNFTKPLVKQVDTLFKETDSKFIKDQAKTLKELQGFYYKEKAVALVEMLAKIDSGIIGRDAAFLSKELATISSHISNYRNLSLEELSVALNFSNMRKIFDRLEFKSLVV